MLANRAMKAKKTPRKAPIKLGKGHPSTMVLGARNQEVVAAGAWVENGQEFDQHPSDVAFYTDELQAAIQRANEEKLQRFQEQVRHRVAAISKRRLQESRSLSVVDRRVPEQNPFVPAEANVNESRNSTRQVRLRLAAYQSSADTDETSEPSVGNWKISLTQHSECDIPRKEDKEGDKDEHVLEENDDLMSDPRIPKVIELLQDKGKLKKQRQSQVLTNRRHFMSVDRQRVKDTNQQKKHLKKTARIKADKEKARLEEERRLEGAQQLSSVRQLLEEREMLVLERLKLEEEKKAAQLERRALETEKGVVATRYIEALRSQVRDRLANRKSEPPPLCYCASSFWESHPDTCANNCVFHNNPKAYAQALQAAVLSMDVK
ncbi:coiled-coil domain-containing protein 15 [Corythoichthys intestinalis]|uniref:coiled-coil domain-containing protein 15 n=1 Tax=Corythoichthys intestinalis TaxID=161448 RepID=UPI0025A625D0|nr:coiled-coil domain-containing protein 15 [Corythoichthys intestinalis]XP_057676041.1 coiled-coil domain-containing protein 15 [Corythoichthys intestinalis]